jgi:hypothetical protein
MVWGRYLEVRQIRKGLEIGRCPLFNGEEDAIHILLKYPETRRLSERSRLEQKMADNED